MKKILLVDDNPEIRKFLGKLLKDNGYSIVEATDGLNALEQILLVDNHPEVRKFLGKLLKDNGYSTEETVNSLYALNKIKLDTFDLVIIDIIMPKMNGIELITIIRDLKLPIKIIAISGGSKYITADKCLSTLLKMDEVHVISKPFHTKLILERVKEIIG